MYALKARPSTRNDVKKPTVRWQVRWKINGQERAKTLATKALAQSFRRRLQVACDDGEPFNFETGLPKKWDTTTVSFFTHAEHWLSSKRPSWSVRTDRSAVEAMTRAVLLTLRPKAPAPPPNVHAAVRAILSGRAPSTTAEKSNSNAARQWIARYSLPLHQLTSARAARLHDDLAVGLRGRPLRPHTANRLRTTVHAAIVAAVDAGHLWEDPWPKRGRRTRKNSPQLTPIDPTVLPSLDDVLQVIDHMQVTTLTDRRAVLATAIGLYAGLRPSEVLVLRPRDVTLPDEEDESSWGVIRVTRAEDGAGGVDSTKTGRNRTVPMHPKLVAVVRSHLPTWKSELRHCGSEPTLTIAGWRYRLHKGCRDAKVDAFSLYTLRHVCATLMLKSGMNHGVAAARLGNSVPILEAYYSGVMRGDEEAGNALMAKVFG